MNALAATRQWQAALEIKPEAIAEALRGTAPSEMRGEVIEFAYGFVVMRRI
ncbi:MAG: hypothetical protein WKF84_17760 [Pyrinomonadaceae bacterium]